MSANLYESLTPKVEEGTPILMPDSVYLQVLREAEEMSYKKYEVQWIANTIGSYQNEKFNQVVEWINEVDKFLKEFNQEIADTTLRVNPIWCNSVLSRIREVRAKHGPSLTFQRVSNAVGSSSIEQQLYYEITSLIIIHYGQKWIELNVPNEASEYLRERINQTDPFLADIKLQLENRIHVTTNSDWYHNKIAETSWLIEKYEPAFYLQSQDVAGSSSMALVSLHEQLRCEKRSLISLKCVGFIVANYIATDSVLKDKFNEELEEGINEVNELLMTIHQELQGKFLEKNFDWYREKIAEARKLIAKNYPAFPLQSQDAEDQNLTSSMQHLQLENGTSTWMMEQNYKPSLFVQVLREFWELDLQHKEDYFIAEAIGSYQTERFQELMEWINEVEKFVAETNPQFQFQGTQDNTYWCRNMLLRIRKLRAKRGPDLNSSSSIKLREELCSEVKLLVNISYGYWTVVSSLTEANQQRINAVHQFVLTTKLQLEGEIPETNSDWYRNKIAETRTMIDRFEPEFSHHPNMAPLPLHEELRREVRSLLKIVSVYLLAGQCISAIYALYPELKDKYTTELQAGIDGVNKFLAEILLQVSQQGKNSDWYTNKIAETKMLIARHYSAFPRPSQDDAGHKPQIFLSFRGGDTRKGFTNYLYEALHNEGFNVFRDNEGLKRGDSISQVLVGAIEKSKVSIIIFSKNYADSRWCLDEVNKILECKEKNGQLIWPIFYKVEPTDVRNQKNSYAVAMAKQEEKFGKDSEKVKKWRSSLSQIADLKALEYKENDDRPESDIIKEIIKDAKDERTKNRL